MWEPRPLTTIWALTACYRDTFTFYLFIYLFFYLFTYLFMVYVTTISVAEFIKRWILQWLVKNELLKTLKGAGHGLINFPPYSRDTKFSERNRNQDSRCVWADIWKRNLWKILQVLRNLSHGAQSLTPTEPEFRVDNRCSVYFGINFGMSSQFWITSAFTFISKLYENKYKLYNFFCFKYIAD
jgi:hypothetical protein